MTQLEGIFVGRRQVSWDEFVQICGPDSHPNPSERRRRIWDAFLEVNLRLRRTIHTPAVWVGGSYLTAKEEPSDIDVVYLVSGRDYPRLEASGRKRIATIGRSLKREKGIPVDSYVLGWPAYPNLDMDDPVQHDYLRRRGYWDDWLQRHSENKAAPNTTYDAIPARGYLEVILDGYAA